MASRSANALLPDRAPPSTRTRRKGTRLECHVASTQPQPFGHDDCLQVVHRLIQSIALVDDDVIVVAHALHLAVSSFQADAPLFVGLRPPLLQAWQQLL